jgi:cytochrome c biogenesis protein CcdA
MNWINHLIDSYNIPLLSAFLIGVMTSVSPCPLATNITAIAFISKEIKSPKNTLINGFYYTLGRSISYTLLATLIYFGLSSFKVSSIFQGWGDKILGFVLVLIGLVMADIFKLKIKINSKIIEKVKLWLTSKGYLGAFLLGMLFALAFCPYSDILFFAVLIPLILKSNEGLLLAPLFALGTGLPVIIFSFIIAFSVNKIGLVFSKVSKVETVIRKITAVIFIIVGIYYLKNFLD